MNIIIVGCGKVGSTLTEQLVKEGHNVTVIDQDEERLAAVTDTYDAIGVVGNGISHKILLEAGIEQADLLLAVTGEDEQNLLCSMVARQTGKCRTIARIRNPLYNEESEFLTREFGLAMITNPESIAATEIANVFRFPFAKRVDSFANGNVDLIHFEIPAGSPLAGLELRNFHTTFPGNLLVCCVIRGEEVIIPGGLFTLAEGDTITVATDKKTAPDFVKKEGLMQNRIRSVMIAGGSRISYYLAKILIAQGRFVTILEKDRERCEDLCEELPQATIICGDASDQNFLMQHGLADTDGFVALTGMDEENILLTLFANTVSKAKTVTKINRIGYEALNKRLHLDTIICPKMITVDMISRFVRSMHKSMNSNVERLYRLADGRAEALEFTIHEGAKVADIPLATLKLKKNTLICSIYRNGQVIVPSGQDRMLPGDKVIVIHSGYRVSDIQEILEA